MENKTKGRRRVITSFIKRHLRKFYVQLCSYGEEMYKKCDARTELLFCLLNLRPFLMSSLPLPSPTSLLKLPISSKDGHLLKTDT